MSTLESLHCTACWARICRVSLPSWSLHSYAQLLRLIISCEIKTYNRVVVILNIHKINRALIKLEDHPKQNHLNN